MNALIISDSDADMNFAAVDVNAGSWSMPGSVSGIAHFLEHMSFLASKKYPQVG